MEWLKCGTEFIVADVIRWREPIRKPQPRWWHPIEPLEIGKPIRRQRDKIGQGKVDRLPWSDETARASIVGSRFVRK